MSRLYKSSEGVPADVLADRLDELALVCAGPRPLPTDEFTMRIPAEVDRDADIVLSEAARRLRAMSWRPIETVPHGRDVLVIAHRTRGTGKPLVMRARYEDKFTVEDHDGGFDENGDYNEANGTYYIPEGWYECSNAHDDYSGYYMAEFTVTAWMPLPPPPPAGRGGG